MFYYTQKPSEIKKKVKLNGNAQETLCCAFAKTMIFF